MNLLLTLLLYSLILIPLPDVRRRAVFPSGTLLAWDDFNRADNSTSLGVSSSGHTWTHFSGSAALGISSNAAYPTAVTPVRKVDVVDVGQANVTVQVTLSNPGQIIGIVFRATDQSNKWAVYYTASANTWELAKYVGGGATLMGSFVQAANSGDRLEVTTNGNNIEVFHNDVSKIAITDSAHSTVTKHGIIMYAATASRLDDFSIVQP